jgi:hypothetical protein
MDKKIGLMLAVLAMGVLLSSAALAVTPAGAAVTSTNLGGYVGSASAAVSLEAGNITQANVASNMSTFKWAGLLGNASGSLKLGDASSNVMYSWNALGKLVYASRVAPAWATLADANAGDVTGAFAFLGAGSDAYATTFTGGSESIGSNLFTINSDFAQTLSSAASTWKTYSLTDGANIVFAGLVSATGTAYNGHTVDYQMIIPEDGTNGNQVLTAWNLYLELV